MRKIGIIVGGAALILTSLIFWKMSLANDAAESMTVNEFTVVTVSNDTVVFNRESFPNRLILNFYSSDCDLCMFELKDIIAFAKANRTDVLFITADSLASMKKFSELLASEGVTVRDNICVAKIDLQAAAALFGDVSVPQTILFKEGLKVTKLKKGLVSGRLLNKGFE